MSQPTNGHTDDGGANGESPVDAALIFGPSPPARPIPLRAGPVSLHFDPEWGFLRDFMVGGRESLRAIYGAVRTDSWATVRPRLGDLQIDDSGDHFRVRFKAVCSEPESGVDFAWSGEVTGERDGSITYDFDGLARAPMRTNRTGLCVLHPCALAGENVSVEHVDGSVSKGVFPRYVEPHQPFRDIRALTHLAAGGALTKVTMEGDTFEMEDQRNWTDASFKTYSTPLSVPLPHRFAAGHRVHQSVRFELIGKAPDPAPREAGPVILTLPDAATAVMPDLGTRWAPDAPKLAAADWQRLKALELGHLLVEVDVTGNDWRLTLGDALDATDALGARLLVMLTYSRGYEPAVAELCGDLASWADRLAGVLVRNPTEASASEDSLSTVNAICGKLNPAPVIAAAPGSTFAELNRHRPDPRWPVAVPVCPQVHTFDYESILENLESQTIVLESVRQFNPHPVFVAPVALLRRRKPDPRQGTLFVAAWTLGAVANLAGSGVAGSLTFYEHAGKNGIFDTPVEDVFACLTGVRKIAPVGISDRARITALAAFPDDAAPRVLIANLTDRDVEVTWGADDEALELGAHAFAAVEFESASGALA